MVTVGIVAKEGGIKRRLYGYTVAWRGVYLLGRDHYLILLEKKCSNRDFILCHASASLPLRAIL